MRFDRGKLPLETKDASRDQGFFRKEAGIVHQEPGAEVVGPVEHQVVVDQQGHHVVGVDMLLIRLHVDVGIQRLQEPSAGLDLGDSDVGRGMEDLPLQVGEIYDVAVNQANRADARRSQIQRNRGTQTSGADDQDLGPAQFLLTFSSHLIEDDLPAVSFDLFFGKIHCRHLFHHVQFDGIDKHAFIAQARDRAFDFFGLA